jgi:hypothetical protein
MELGTEHIGPQVCELHRLSDCGDLGPPAFTKCGMLGQISIQHLRVAPSLTEHVQGHRKHRADDVSPAGVDGRDLKIIRQPAEDFLR